MTVDLTLKLYRSALFQYRLFT